MRDDLHKGAPVPRRFRSLIRECARDGQDWAERTAYRANAAVVGELSGEISSRFIQAFLTAATGRQQVLGITWASDLGLGGTQPSPLESRVIDHFERIVATDGVSKESLVRALGDAITERVESHVRAFDGHLACKFPTSRREAMHRVRAALGQVPVSDHAAAIVRGERPSLPPARRGPTTVDQDLR